MGTRRRSALSIAALALMWLWQLPDLGAYNGRSGESERWFSERLDQLDAAASPVSAAAADPSTIARRLNELDSAVPLLRTTSTEILIESLLSRHRQKARTMLAYRPLYYPLIEAGLAERGLPAELKCLPMAASALNPAGRFSDGRAGLWGFTEPTARLYGLRIDAQLDERLDPERSTQAAVLRLQDLHEAFGDWRLAIAAHGGGPAAVRRAMQRAGGNREFERVEHYLPNDSLALLDAFSAALYLDRFQDLHGLRSASPRLPTQVQTVVVESPLELKAVASALDTPLDTLTALNPQWLSGRAVPVGEQGARLRIPADMVQTFAEAFTVKPPPAGEIAAGSSPASTDATIEDALQWKESYSLTVYHVRPGDSLGRISRRYGVSISDLRRWNGLRSDLIFPGQQLEVRAPDRGSRQPRSSLPPKPQPAPAPQPKGLELRWHQVRSGETLGGIAEEYQVRISDLRRWNAISGDLIYAGQRLKVYTPPGQSVSSAAAKPEPLKNDAPRQYYVIRAGDTLWSIARRFPGISAEDLKRLNGLEDARSLRPGMRILIPSGD